MSTQTPNLNLTKPAQGETGWRDALNANWDTLDAMSYVRTCIFWNLLTGQPETIIQGTWYRQQDSTRLDCGEFRNPTIANGDGFICKCRCPAGTYTLRFNAVKHTDGGIVKIYIDDVQVGNAGGYDLYAGAKDVLNIIEITGLTLTAGEHSLKFIEDGKNASSTGYRLRASGIWLQRTA